MAGRYIEFINPGYSTLYTKDLPYTPGAGEATGFNPFDPKVTGALVEGEWLERAGAGKHLTRGGSDNVVTAAGTADDEGTNPSFMYFQEEGRYDAQATRRAHVIEGPVGFTFRCKLHAGTDAARLPVLHSAVSIWDYSGPAGAWGYARRVIGKRNAGWGVGKVVRVGSDSFDIMYLPGAV